VLQAIGYYIALPFIYLLSLLPFPLLYLFSDFVFALLYYVIRYRRDVVSTNLRNSFPHKSEAEIKDLTRRFFRYLCDMFIETFKTLTISPKAMLRHCSLSADAQMLFQQLAASDQSVILVMGHYGNWEWGGNSFSLTCNQQLYVIYHPLANKHFDGLMYRMRSRFGTRLIAMKNTFREMLGNRKILAATAFIADQTPQPDNAYWTTFLNQDTPVFRGTGIIARKLGLPVVYVSIGRVRRGYYSMHAEMLVPDPASLSEDEISEIHTRRLEKDIIADPAIWLWSHKRWKHRRPAASVAE